MSALKNPAGCKAWSGAPGSDSGTAQSPTAAAGAPTQADLSDRVLADGAAAAAPYRPESAHKRSVPGYLWRGTDTAHLCHWPGGPRPRLQQAAAGSGGRARPFKLSSSGQKGGQHRVEVFFARSALNGLISLSTSGWITAGTKYRGACPSGAGAGAQFCCASLSRTLSGSPLERGASADLRKALAEELLRWQVRLWWVRFPRVEERRAQMTHCNCLRVRGTSGIEPVEHGTKQ